MHAVGPAELRQLAERYNRQTPRLAAKNVQEERMTVDGRTLVYTYRHLTLSARRLQSMNVAARQRAAVLPSVCADAAARRVLRDGVAFRYRYLSLEGAVVGIVQIDEGDCRNAH